MTKCNDYVIDIFLDRKHHTTFLYMVTYDEAVNEAYKIADRYEGEKSIAVYELAGLI